MKPSFINIDQLQAETTLQEAAAKCGVTLEVHGHGPELRMDCPFRCPGDHAGRKEIAINTENPQKIFLCHAYQCSVRGNLLTLMHGWLTGRQPSGGKLKGDEFQRVKGVLAKTAVAEPPVALKQPLVVQDLSVANVPLAQATDERIRELATIHTKFVTDLATMNPAAFAYVRRHPCLTHEALQKWRVGYLPNDGGGDKRGWSLRGGLVYPVYSEGGQVLAWVGRDVHFEDKDRAFSLLAPAERQGCSWLAAQQHAFFVRCG